MRAVRSKQRGAALMVTLIIITSLMAGASVVVALQLQGSRGTNLTRSGMTSEYCAEAGAERAAPIVASSYNAWAASLCGSAIEAGCVPASPAAEVALFSGINHDIDGDGVADFVLYLRDDQDEPGTAQDYKTDRNTRVYIVSTCIKYPDTPRQVKELIQLPDPGSNYASQQGGEWSNNNVNP